MFDQNLKEIIETKKKAKKSLYERNDEMKTILDNIEVKNVSKRKTVDQN